MSTFSFGPWGSRTEDLHVRFRVSNVIVDISGRLEKADRTTAREALLTLAHHTATTLEHQAH
ncbi:MAG: hypothetical protein GEV11_09790 [Streptosporangiales bacterium]|nr:hypothetical protein [Streptosporangiales bacterium]